MLLGQTAAATEQWELQHNLWQPAKMLDIVPTLKASYSLLSTSKFADANYITMFTPMNVKLYYGETTTIQASKPPFLAGWRDNKSGLWHVPLTAHKTETELTNKQENANNVFELPSISQIVAYYHVVAGYPTKPTWLAVMRKGFYATWPLLMEQALNKDFPESTEMSKGHMWQQLRGFG